MFLHSAIEVLRHLPDHLQAWAAAYGSGLYAILGFVIFAETGLVVTPFLPGDSLLFATGAVVSMGLPSLSLPVMAAVLVAAALSGDMLNYHVGKWVAPRLFEGTKIRWLNEKHLQRTREFYARHGGKTLIFARFVPIVRTYAPFVAGIGGLPFRRFFRFSLAGGTLWILLLLTLGFFFGNIPAVKSNFELVILGIIAVSLAPVAVEVLRKT
jgi:membrane-associated protein